MEITPELQQKMVGIVDYLETAIKQSAEFAADQAPEVVQQLLAYHYVANIFFVVFTTLLFVFFASFAVLAIRKGISEKEKCRYDGDGWFAIGFFQIIFAIGSAAGFFAGLLEVVKISLAPKLYLLEFAASLLK